MDWIMKLLSKHREAGKLLKLSSFLPNHNNMACMIIAIFQEMDWIIRPFTVFPHVVSVLE